MTRNNIIPLHRSTELPAEWYADHAPVDYDRWPSSGPARHVIIGDSDMGKPITDRDADASHSSLLRVSTIGGIAIAAFLVLLFGGQLIRGWLS